MSVDPINNRSYGRKSSVNLALAGVYSCSVENMLTGAVQSDVRQDFVAPAKAGAQEMLHCPRINPLDSGLRRNDGGDKGVYPNLHITLNRTPC